jgi:hypothetical protein
MPHSSNEEGADSRSLSPSHINVSTFAEIQRIRHNIGARRPRRVNSLWKKIGSPFGSLAAVPWLIAMMEARAWRRIEYWRSDGIPLKRALEIVTKEETFDWDYPNLYYVDEACSQPLIDEFIAYAHGRVTHRGVHEEFNDRLVTAFAQQWKHWDSIEGGLIHSLRDILNVYFARRVATGRNYESFFTEIVTLLQKRAIWSEFIGKASSTDEKALDDAFFYGSMACYPGTWHDDFAENWWLVETSDWQARSRVAWEKFVEAALRADAQTFVPLGRNLAN